MAGTYGRGSAASSSRAQAGSDGSAYQYAASSADRYLETDERAALSSAKTQAGQADVTGGKKKRNRQADRRATAADQAGRLREVASTRALDDFNTSGIQLSKPWLQQASQGLISGVGGDVDASAAYGAQTTAFGSVGVAAAKETKGKLSNLAGTSGLGIPTNLLGGAVDQGRAQAQAQYGQHQIVQTPGVAQNQLERENPQFVQQGITKDFGVTSIADASRAYTGLSGGTTTAYDSDPNTKSVNQSKKKKNTVNSNWRQTFGGRLQ